MLSPAARELAGHCSGGGEQLLVHHLLYTFICIYIYLLCHNAVLYRAKATVSGGPKELRRNRIRTAHLNWSEGYSILFLFSILVNSFISIHKFYFVGFFFTVLSHIPLGSKGSEQTTVW